MKPRELPLPPSTIRAARALFPKANGKRLRHVAETIDYCTRLSSLVRTCAVILRSFEPPDSRKKKIARDLAKGALRAAIQQSGYTLDQLDTIIG